MTMEIKPPTDTVQASKLLTMLNVEIGNRQSKRQHLREQLIAIEAEIAAFNDVRDHLDKMAQ